MSKNVGDLAVKLSAQYDNTGIRLMTRDITDSSRMIEGMSASARAFAAINPMTAAMSNTNVEMMAREREAEVAAQNRREWAERGRIRDQAIRDEVQAARIAAIEKRNAEIAAQKQVTTAHILETVRRQQADARSNRTAFMFGQDRTQTFLSNQGAIERQRLGMNLGSTSADNNMNNRGFVGAMAIQQTAFALQDFQSQMVNAKTTAEGFGRGMMAVSNNVQMLGMAFGPTGLAITAVAGAIISVGVPALMKWLDTEAKVIEQAKKARDAMGKWLEPRLEAEGMRGRARNKAGLATSITEGAEDVISAEIAKQEFINNELAKFARKTTPAEKIRREELLKEREESNKIIEQEERKKLAVKPMFDREQEKLRKDAERKAADDRLEQYDRDKQHEQEFNDWVRDGKEKLIRDQIQAENAKQLVFSENLENLRQLDQNPNGSSAANIRGTGAAVSAINRAIAGTNSEESDRKKQIKVLEDQLKVSQNIERKLNLQRAAL